MSDLEKIIQRIEDKLASLDRTREQIKQELEAERAQLDSIDKALASLRSVESKVTKKVAKK
ncbi:hypothetical protein FRD01_04340 [Microvenator marinus]|jgi:chromosome segregation ATPase|uniref:Uncharacterized protein n=1 Tax=Microvenator marinus TaxID=2600177 RepID=A0A5B8XN09_9DELT|nr:hypothetical protein [Microvenator marinus]QED26487.1 hypothetical protein FRD01_04340 [Microvenator marinus]